LHTISDEHKKANMIGKKKKYLYAWPVLLTCFLLALGFRGLAQKTDVNALKVRLQKSKPDSSRTAILLRLSNYYNNLPQPLSHVSKALAYAGAAEKLSVSLADHLGIGNSYAALSKAWRNRKDSIRAKEYLQRANNVFVANGFFREAAEAVLNMEELYQYFGGTDLNIRIAYYKQALLLFKRSTARDREEATLKVLGDFYYVQANYPQSLLYLRQALPLVKFVKTIDKESLYDLLGSVYTAMGSLDKGLEYGLLAIKMTERGKDTTMQACAVYNRVGITYYNMKQYGRAGVFYEKALHIAVKNRDLPTQINLYVNIASALITGGRNGDCIELLKRVEKKYPPALIAENIGVYYAMLKCYTRLKKFDEAKTYLNRVEIFSQKIDQNDNSQIQIQSILSDYYVTTIQDKPARRHLAFFKKLAVAHHSPVAMGQAYRLEARLDSAENNYAAAYKNYRIAGTIKDSLYTDRKTKQITQLEMLFETEKKDQQLMVKNERIKLLNSQAHLQQINLKQGRTAQKLIIGGALLLFILLGLSYNSYRLKKRINRQLQTQRKEIEDKNGSLSELVDQKDKLLAEKEWLMKEIHHRVKNNLQIVISLLSTQSSYLDNDIAYNAIRESQHRMQSISLIHQKLYQSENLALVEICAYISELVAYLRDSFDTGSRIGFQMDIVHTELDVTRAVPLGLILNEAITNSIKYAFPDHRKGKISITLKKAGENSLVLSISDNGVGIPATVEIGKRKSLGMSLMRGLSKQLGGQLSIESSNGITVSVEFINEIIVKVV
jgi:two-component sensor histidine kinase